jgi:NitT/TauT family transport system substrate-binding protein
MRLRRAGFLTLAGAAALPLPALAQGAPIRLGSAANDSAAEAYYADELGLFKKAGLNVEISTFTNGVTMAQALVGGSLDVAGNNIVSLATAISKGIPFALLAGGAVYNTDAPTTVLCVAKNSPLRSAKDLEGKTVAVASIRDITYASAAAWIEQNHGTLANVKFVEIPFPQASAALERGTVDAAMIAEPSLSAGLRAGSIRIFGKAYDAIGKRFMFTLTFAMNDWIKKNAETARKLSQAIYDSGRWGNIPANQQHSAEILARYAKLDPAAIAAMTRSTYSTGTDPKLLQPPLDIAYRYKLLDRPMLAAELLPH